VHLVSDADGDMVRIEVCNVPTGAHYRKGMGVGKLIVEAIAQMHGGSVEEKEGEAGTRQISILLPRVRSAA
jgi:signal transduction histidine kinase